MTVSAGALKELVQQAAQLDNQGFEQLIQHLYEARIRQHVPAQDLQETALLKKINAGFPLNKWERMQELQDKQQHAELNAEESSEIASLVAAYERYTYRRLTYLGKLAAMRKTTLQHVMVQLGIGNHQNGYG
jgi:hypothetical protein